MELKNQVAIITGAARGLGKAIAKRVLEEGAIAIITDINEETLNDTVVELGAFGQTDGYFMDVSDFDSVQKTISLVVKKYKRIDILVNNAGIFLDCDFFEITEEMFERTMDVNLKGYFLLMQSVAKHMVETKVHGRIVNISSALSVTGCELQPHYAASKAGVNMLTKAGAYALAPYGITVNAIMPGTIETKANQSQLSDPITAEFIISRTPLKSYGKPEYIAEAVKYFLTKNAEWTTGSILSVDGGYLA